MTGRRRESGMFAVRVVLLFQFKTTVMSSSVNVKVNL